MNQGHHQGNKCCRLLKLAMLFSWGVCALAISQCAHQEGSGRMGTVEAEAEATIDAKVQAALVQWETKIVNKISNRLSAKLEARFGNNAGRDAIENTTDSLTSVILAGGLIMFLLGLLTVIYKIKSADSERVSQRLIGTIEPKRERKPCNCGKCADCIAEELRGQTDRIGRLLHKRVKQFT